MGALQKKEVPRLDDAVCTAEVVRKTGSALAGACAGAASREGWPLAEVRVRQGAGAAVARDQRYA